uniref:5'-deoxynucleotidase HDDC2 n=1 Tax=Rhabditophanes sp. KR3021 TaxID=114890 RepID=A0AC35UHW6_9BILA
MSVEIFDLLKIIDNVKHLRRTGWTKFAEITEVESVASHMYRMSLLSWSLAKDRPDLDINKCIKMSLIHDLAEGDESVGDITPYCGVSDEKKYELELGAFMKIVSYVPECVGKEWIELWKDYEIQGSNEAKCVKQLDKFDMIAQAWEYEQKYKVDLSQFFDSTKDIFNFSPVDIWAEKLLGSRTHYREQNNISNK